MCGICGFNFKDQKLIDSMNQTISHRGPDDSGTYCVSNLSFGQGRLSIQDLTKKGHQPMKYKHLTIVFNGEIYNFNDIKKELLKKKYTFKSTGDTEVILAAYLEWGQDCVKKFNGMWAFCIYDSKTKQLFFSRDRYGKKPLYYYLKDNKLIFASEIKAILNHNIKREINEKSLHEYFNYRFTYDDNTFFKHIYNFKPAHNMTFDLKTNKITQYKKYYTLKIKKSNISFKQAKQETIQLLDQSVKYRMISDVPVATFLSGGLDSSLITYFAKKYNNNLNTFSIGFDTTNELGYANIVAKTLNTNHKEFKINKDNVLEYLEDMVYHMDEPIGADPGFLPIFVLSKKTSKYNRVVLTGDGADEIFTGYDRYKLLQYGQFLKNFSFFKTNNQIIQRLNSMKNKSPMQSFFEITRVFEQDEIKKLHLTETHPNFKPYEKLNTHTLNKVQLFDINNLLLKDFFMKSDKMSSAFGLEQRTPFMDKKLVEYALSLPIKFRLNKWNEKFILKSIAKDLLPQEISKRRKHGFNVPIDYWFTNTLKDKLVELLQKNNHNYYNKNYIYKLLEKLQINNTSFKSKNIIAQKLWSVLIFEMWFEKYLK